MDDVDQLKDGGPDILLLEPQSYHSSCAIVSSELTDLDCYYVQGQSNRAGCGTGCDYTVKITQAFMDRLDDDEVSSDEEEQMEEQMNVEKEEMQDALRVVQPDT